MAAKNSVRAIPGSFFLSTNLLVDTPQAINPGGLPHQCFLVRITNDTGIDVLLSIGTTDEIHEYIPDGDVVFLPIQGNAIPGQILPIFPQGTVFYVSGNPGQAGWVWLSGYYQEIV